MWLCSIAEKDTTFSQGKEAIKTALQKNTLYKDIKDNRAALSERSAKHVGGAGVQARGKLDWELVSPDDDQQLCDTRMIHARYMRYTHDTSHDIYVRDTRTIHARYMRYTRDMLDTSSLLECTCLAPHRIRGVYQWWLGCIRGYQNYIVIAYQRARYLST